MKATDDVQEFVYVGEEAELSDGRIKVVEGIDRVPICVVALNGGVHALSAICTHEGAPMWEGRTRGEYLECPWRKALFKISNGWPASRDLRAFPVMAVKGGVYVGRRTARPHSSFNSASPVRPVS